jgi:hypothetical protein
MPTNKDIKELLEARKRRRAIPQVDPAKVVVGPEPDEPAPARPASPPNDSPQAAEATQPIIEEPPQLAAPVPAPIGQPTAPPAPAGLEVDDPRTQPAPADDPYIPKTLRVRRHHDRQLRAEAYYRDMLMQDILETALDEYFKKRYGRPGRGQRQQ